MKKTVLIAAILGLFLATFSSCSKEKSLTLPCQYKVNGNELCGNWERICIYNHISNIDTLLNPSSSDSSTWTFDNSGVKTSNSDPQTVFTLSNDTIKITGLGSFKLKISNDTLIAFAYVDSQAIMFRKF